MLHMPMCSVWDQNQELFSFKKNPEPLNSPIHLSIRCDLARRYYKKPWRPFSTKEYKLVPVSVNTSFYIIIL